MNSALGTCAPDTRTVTPVGSSGVSGSATRAPFMVAHSRSSDSGARSMRSPKFRSMTSVFSSDRSTCTGAEVHTSTSTGSRSRAPAMALITELFPRLTSPTTTTVPRSAVSPQVRRIAAATSLWP